MTTMMNRGETQQALSQADMMRLTADPDAPSWPSGDLEDGQRLDGGAAPERLASLTRAVEAEIIPRLLLTERAGPRSRGLSSGHGQAARVPDSLQVASFVDLALARGKPGMMLAIDGMLADGVDIEAIYLDLLTPAARRLGEMWEDDLCGFAEVTIGLLRIQQMTRDLGPLFLGKSCVTQASPRALLVALPGEQHRLGLSMVQDFFRRAGWNVWSGSVGSSHELATLVRRERFSIVGLSVVRIDRMEEVAQEIRMIRRFSCNPAAGIMVGGPAFSADPHLAAMVGADATATDGRQAVQQARTLMTVLAA